VAKQNKGKQDSIDVLKAVKALVADSKTRKFKESVEISINLKDVDLKSPKSRIEDEVILPKGRGKELKVCVIGGAELSQKAKGIADRVLVTEDIDTLAKNNKELKKLVNETGFFLAEASLMPSIGKKFGKIMAPRGKMPRPIPPSADPTPIVKNMRNTVRIKTSKNARTFHVFVGTREMSPEDLVENINAVMKRVLGKLERGAQNIDSVYVKSTMGTAQRIM
jgi:large subunit ribosomal protein L1